MENVIKIIPVYNILTNLIPGTVLAGMLKLCVPEIDIFTFTDNLWMLGVILYFIGVVNSRISSLIIEPILKKLNWIEKAPHKNFVKAELKDSTGKLTSLGRMSNEYRAYLSVFIIVGVLKALLANICLSTFLEEYGQWIFILFGIILFSVSYIKQNNFVKSRTESILETEHNNG